MPTLVDSKFAALRGQGFTGAVSDMVLQWLQSNGATSNAIPDAWQEMLTALGGSSPQKNDSWYEVLGSLGYTGNLNDRELAFWLDGGTFTEFDFNGVDQYVTHSSWDTLGDYSVYGEVTFTADGAQDDVVDLPPPLTEFGRVGANYHAGPIKNVRYTDKSPIQNTSVNVGAIGTIPEIFMENAHVSFDLIMDATPGEIIVGYLNATGGTLTLEDDTDTSSLVVDGVSQANNFPVSTGQHYRIEFDATGGKLTNVRAHGGMQNLVITTSAT